jgi:hypothetical protein
VVSGGVRARVGAPQSPRAPRRSPPATTRAASSRCRACSCRPLGSSHDVRTTASRRYPRSACPGVRALPHATARVAGRARRTPASTRWIECFECPVRRGPTTIGPNRRAAGHALRPSGWHGLQPSGSITCHVAQDRPQSCAERRSRVLLTPGQPVGHPDAAGQLRQQRRLRGCELKPGCSSPRLPLHTELLAPQLGVLLERDSRPRKCRFSRRGRTFPVSHRYTLTGESALARSSCTRRSRNR